MHSSHARFFFWHFLAPTCVLGRCLATKNFCVGAPRRKLIKSALLVGSALLSRKLGCHQNFSPLFFFLAISPPLQLLLLLLLLLLLDKFVMRLFHFLAAAAAMAAAMAAAPAAAENFLCYFGSWSTYR